MPFILFFRLYALLEKAFIGLTSNFLKLTEIRPKTNGLIFSLKTNIPFGLSTKSCGNALVQFLQFWQFILLTNGFTTSKSVCGGGSN